MSRSPLPLCLLLFAAALTALTSGGCTAFEVLDATVPDSGYVRTSDVRYGPLSSLLPVQRNDLPIR